MSANGPADLIIPVIDIFAGPGGLSEGFSAFSTTGNEQPFKIKLSIESDKAAHSTLLLRAFYRQFTRDRVPAAYYDFLRNTSDLPDARLKKLFDQHPAETERAKGEARHATLGEEKPATIRQWIDNALGDVERWVLIGGPPCQAYSIAGRSRNKGIDDYIAEDDKRQRLYIEYLQIMADHLPAIFIMENVKGLLSATRHQATDAENINSGERQAGSDLPAAFAQRPVARRRQHRLDRADES